MHRDLTSPSARTPLRVVDAILLLAALLTIVTGIAPVLAIPLRVSHDYGEGWSAYWTAAAMGRGPLYSATRVFTANNYPPLSFYVVGLLGRAVGDYIVAGRIVALASMLGVAALIARIVTLLGASRRWAAAGVLAFLLYNLIYFRQFVAIDNPQWLGQLVMLAALPPLLSAPPARLGTRSLCLSALTMVAAGLVKHNQFALPLSVAIWLLVHDRRAFAIWAGAALSFAAIACLALYAIWGPAVFVEMLGFRRTVSVTTFVLGLKKTAALLPMLLVTALAGWRCRHRPGLALAALLAVLGTVLGILQRLGNGVNVNAHYDGLIGLCIASAAFAGIAPAAETRGYGRWRQVVLLLLILSPIILVAPRHVRSSFGHLESAPGEAAEWRASIAAARAARAPVFCEVLAVCYWADRPIGIDFFAYGEKLRTGADPQPLARAIETRTPGAIILVRDQDYFEGKGRLPRPFPALIEANYRPVLSDVDDMTVMVPARR